MGGFCFNPNSQARERGKLSDRAYQFISAERVMVSIKCRVIGRYGEETVRDDVRFQVDMEERPRQAPYRSDWPTNSSIEGHRWHPASPLSSFNSYTNPAKMGGKTLSSVALLLPLLTATANAASDPPRPRGVGPECTSIAYGSYQDL